jgi:PleD family two-component response regulator
MYKVLIIDDDPDDLFLLEEVLECNQSYEITTLSEVNQLNKFLNEDNFDCIIIDFFLGRHDGLTIVSNLKKSGLLKLTPVILLTGQNNQRIKAKAASEGIANFQVKHDVMREPKKLDAVIMDAIKTNELNQSI